MLATPEHLRRIRIFKHLPEELLQAIGHTSVMRTFTSGELICTPHDPTAADYFYLVKEGTIDVTALANDGRRFTIDQLRHGDILGYPLIAEQPQQLFGYAMRASSDARVCLIKRGVFLRILREHPDVTLALLDELTQKLLYQEARLRDLALADVTHRLLNELRRIGAADGERRGERTVLRQRFTHDELARRIGTSRETVTRAFGRLTDEGAVVVDDLRIAIADPSAERTHTR